MRTNYRAEGLAASLQQTPYFRAMREEERMLSSVSRMIIEDNVAQGISINGYYCNFKVRTRASVGCAAPSPCPTKH